MNAQSSHDPRVLALGKQADEIVQQTQHIGERYKNGRPNNCQESNVESTLKVLSFMLKEYHGSAI